ncbi:MAG: hypothetical protein QM628_00265 [Propionicimonas sp.]
MSNIPSTPADGNVKTVVCTAIANINAPTLAELTGGTVKDISCYITAGGFALTLEQEPIADDRECDTFTAQQPGRVSAGSPTVTVIDNTGTSLEATSNDGVGALTGTVYIVRRYGLPHTTAFAATTQKVDVFVCKVGKKQRIQPEANSVLRATFPLFVQDYAQDVTVTTT